MSMKDELVFKEPLLLRATWIGMWLIPLIGGLVCIQNPTDISIRELGWILIIVSFLPFFFGVYKPRKILAVTKQGICCRYSFWKKSRFIPWNQIDKIELHEQVRPSTPTPMTISIFYYVAVFTKNAKGKVDSYIPIWKCLPSSATEKEAQDLLSTIETYRSV